MTRGQRREACLVANRGGHSLQDVRRLRDPQQEQERLLEQEDSPEQVQVYSLKQTEQGQLEQEEHQRSVHLLQD